MGLLLYIPTGREHTLGGRTLIGRSPACAVCVREREISGEHAAITWTSGAWTLRDLGSRNGTFIDGRRLPPGGSAPLTPESRLAFGGVGEWRLSDDGPPVPQARRARGDASRLADGGVLLLPDDEAPELSIYCDDEGGWVLDRGDGVEPAFDQQILRAGGQTWRIYLPFTLPPTAAASGGLRLAFRVSRDEEFVELDVICRGQARTIQPRSANYLLLTLARERLGDSALAPAERGWIHQDDVADRLRLSTTTVKVQVHRARQYLGRAGIERAALIERRARTGLLRLATDDFQIAPIEG